MEWGGDEAKKNNPVFFFFPLGAKGWGGGWADRKEDQALGEDEKIGRYGFKVRTPTERVLGWQFVPKIDD